MGNTYTIDGYQYLSMIKSGAANLGKNRETVNNLNVFPIPDGDTGDNMYLTAKAGASTDAALNLGKCAGAVASAMLLGARGNSGVILSRIFAGIAKALSGTENADVETIKKAADSGIKSAYQAVSNPVEGTILTVYREAAEKAAEADIDSFEDYLDVFISEAKESLERTPELLSVLKEAGVVDSGGAGLLLIFEGMLDALKGTVQTENEPETSVPAMPKMDLDKFSENSELTFGYCTEFLLRLTNSKVNVKTFDETELFNWLYANGESVVAFREESIVKVHIHTMKPGEVINYAQQFGEFLTMKIENMNLQHNQKITMEPETKEPLFTKKILKKFGSVAVACGDGVKEMFTSLGVDAVVDGGQSMNPSAVDFQQAFDQASAETIFVFPNNGNVILAAQQAAELYQASDVRVIPTKDIGQGYAAISVLDYSSENADEIQAALEEAYEEVTTGCVSSAVRDADMNGIHVNTGDYIGYVGKTILSSNKERLETAVALADKIKAGDHDILIIVRGADVPESEADELASALEKKYKHLEVIPTVGLQPIQDYILILE